MNARGRSGPGNGRPPLDAAQPSAEELRLSPEARARLRALRSMGLDDNDDFADSEGERDDLTDVPGGVRLQKVLAAAGVAAEQRGHLLLRQLVELVDDRDDHLRVLGPDPPVEALDQFAVVHAEPQRRQRR